MKPRILVISSAESDFCLHISRLPRAGEEVSDGGTREYRCSGRGAAAAVTFSRLGGDCLFCCKLGSDADGARLKQVFGRQGIDTRFMTAARETATDFAVVLEDADGVRRIRFPGASARLSAVDVEEAFTAYPDAVFLHPDVPESAALAALCFAARQKIPVVADASTRSLSYPLERFSESGEIDIFITNSARARELTGIEPTSLDACLRAAVTLAGAVRARYFIIKLGERGAFLYDNKYYKLVPTYECSVVDRAAAGDAFSAALALEYLRSREVTASVRYANAVAAVVLSREGDIESIPDAAAVQAFIEDTGVRHGE